MRSAARPSMDQEEFVGVYFLGGNGRGDVLLITPALRGIRRQHPDAVIGCAIEHSDLLQGNPNVDCILDLATAGRRLFEDMYQRATRHVFLDYARRLPQLRSRSVLEVLCDLAGVENDGRGLELFLTEEEVRSATALADELSFQRQHPLVALQSAAGTPNREWPLNSWSILARSCPEIVMVQVGGAADGKVDGAIDLRGRLTHRAVAALVQQCDAVIAGDTFLPHAAFAVSTPAVVLFGSSHPTAFGHAGNVNLALEDVSCAPCYRPVSWMNDTSQTEDGRIVPWECSHRACLAEMGVEGVREALYGLLPDERVVQ